MLNRTEHRPSAKQSICETRNLSFARLFRYATEEAYTARLGSGKTPIDVRPTKTTELFAISRIIGPVTLR